MKETEAIIDAIGQKQHALLAIRAALATGEKQALCDLVCKYRAYNHRVHKRANIINN